MRTITGLMVICISFFSLGFAKKAKAAPIKKKPVHHLNTEACRQIAADTSQFTRRKISKTTRYYTPLFKPGKNGGLRKVDRRACINIEGSCVVGKYLYNWAGRGKPWGVRYDRATIVHKFGKGNGRNRFNRTNALDPCRTVAADQSKHPVGTVLYIPAMKGKTCPQTGKPVDGCFVVSDVGAAIKGNDRYDLFTGECANYDKKYYYCLDKANRDFGADKGTPYYVIDRDHALATALREEADQHIERDWQKP